MESVRAERWYRGRGLFRGLKVRVAATVGLLAGGVVWIILYLAFLAGHYAWYQNLAVILSTLVIVPSVLLVMWILWGIGVGRRFRDWSEDSFEL
jgi:hypothetical protein